MTINVSKHAVIKHPHITPELCRKFLRYEPDTGKLFWRPREPSDFREGKRTAETACKIWNTKNAGKETFLQVVGGRLTSKILRHNLLAHRVIWAIVYGEWPDEIDHDNGDPTDNRLQNLRSVSRVVNLQNAALHSNNTSGHSGVSYYRRSKRWVARIGFRGRKIHLGLYDTIEEAITVREAAERELGFHPNHGRRRSRYSRNDR